MAKTKPAERTRFPIVGIGASAGGLAAFEEFFSGIPESPDLELSFVLVQHLDPVHKSLLSDLVRGFTTLPVSEAVEGLFIEPNNVYVIPPGQIMTLVGGALHLEPYSTPRGRHLPIDVFFQSLAEDRGPLAVAVVLSGTGHDGALGIQAIRQHGGFVLAQDRGSAEYEGMPNSAVDSGKVDEILPAGEMMARIFLHFDRPDEADASLNPPGEEATLNQIFDLLRTRTTHDFTKYKPSTIRRRMARRMLFNGITTLSGYWGFLDKNPEEVLDLFGDLLIGVTSFFRDPKVFSILEERVIPKLFALRAPGAIRVWSAGCSTGEEAYSLAILLREKAEELGESRSIHIFASDIDRKAIAGARSGIYSLASLAGLSEARIQRFFTANQDGKTVKVRKNIRDLVVFSEHDIIKDPPFFKLDLLICRNLLIYLSLDLQKKIIPMFHYALNPGGVLVLGTSETIGEFGHLFQPLDRTGKVFVRRETQSTYPLGGTRFASQDPGTLPVPLVRKEAGSPPRPSLRELTESTLLRVLATAAALVNPQGDILYLHGKTGSFLEPSPGVQGVANILKMAKEGLKYPLTTALYQAATQKESVHCPKLRMSGKEQNFLVNLSVHPVEKGALDASGPLFLVVMDEEVVPLVPLDAPAADSVTLEALRQELRLKDEYLRRATEEMETSNEELNSSNEELQSVNEELQSSNEELETSKEELQSTNEELSTVNAELISKLAELTTANNDMNNLLAATGIATVFVDLKLKILRFTPESTRVINLIPSDLGRPVGHLASNLVDYQTLEQDTHRVLDTLVPHEAEVQSRRAAWYRLRIQPYRTIDNVIEGAVISFVDITEIVRQRDALVRTNELLRHAALVQDSGDAMVVQDLEGVILAWNPAAVRRYGWTEAEALGTNVRDHIPSPHQTDFLERIRRPSLSDALVTYDTQRLTKGGTRVDITVTTTALVDRKGKIYAILTMERERGTKL